MDEAHKKALRANLEAWISSEILQKIKFVQLGETDAFSKKRSSEHLDSIVDIIAGDL